MGQVYTLYQTHISLSHWTKLLRYNIRDSQKSNMENTVFSVSSVVKNDR